MKWVVMFCLVVVLLVGCVGTRLATGFQEILNIHDIFFAEYEPENYDDCVKWDETSFKYDEAPCIVIQFGGLQLTEDNVVRWGVVAEIFHNGVYVAGAGPTYFVEDLNDGNVEQDRYLVRIPLSMVDAVPPGLYKFKIYIVDQVEHDMVEASIEFSLLPRDIYIMYLWDELVGREPEIRGLIN